MILETKTNQEFHANGKLAYAENIAILSPASAALYENRRIHPDGYEWIRTGRHEKYYDNGQLAWVICYDNNGSVVKGETRNFRRDGSTITY